MSETPLFTRHGKAHTGPVGRDSKGNPFTTKPHTCSRCGGAGRADKWAHTGYVCFDCRGRGNTGTDTVKLYTADKLAKLNAAKAKADARREAARIAKAAVAATEAAARSEAFLAEHAALIARAKPHMEDAFIGDVMGKALAKNLITVKQAEAVLASVDRIEAWAKAKAEQAVVAAASRHVGKVGERVEIAVTVERVAKYERPSFSNPRYTDTVFIITMRDADGNALVSKTPSFHAEAGEQLTIKATIKEHSEYNGEQQTVLQRIKVKEEAKQ
jgi:hypothetical protein